MKTLTCHGCQIRHCSPEATLWSSLAAINGMFDSCCSRSTVPKWYRLERLILVSWTSIPFAFHCNKILSHQVAVFGETEIINPAPVYFVSPLLKCSCSVALSDYRAERLSLFLITLGCWCFPPSCRRWVAVWRFFFGVTFFSGRFDVWWATRVNHRNPLSF